MHLEVKKFAENQDIKRLRYIFLDCLDVDPTFEEYKEDYKYCKSLPGMFEDHKELRGISSDKNKWTEEYWVQLKFDLMKNFSQERFEHMIEVAQIVYKDKIKRLLNERKALQQAKNESNSKLAAEKSNVNNKENPSNGVNGAKNEPINTQKSPDYNHKSQENRPSNQNDEKPKTPIRSNQTGKANKTSKSRKRVNNSKKDRGIAILVLTMFVLIIVIVVLLKMRF